MTQNGGQNFDSSSRALGAFDQRGPYGILIHLGMDFLKMNESQFQAENPAAKTPLPYRQLLLIFNPPLFYFLTLEVYQILHPFHLDPPHHLALVNPFS